MISPQASQNSLSELIRRAREANNLTQLAFGRFFKPPVAQPTVARWEKGELMPDRRHFPRIASLLNLTLEELYELIEGQLDKVASLPLIPDANTYIPNKRHIAILNRGAETWNRWRQKNPELIPQLAGAEPLIQDLGGVDLRDCDLRGIKFSMTSLCDAKLLGADLREARLSKVNLYGADLREANLSQAKLSSSYFAAANLSRTNFSEAILRDTNFYQANLTGANCTNADFTGSDLRCAVLNNAIFENATLICCLVYGISAWNIRLKGARQKDLNICPHNVHLIYVQDLRTAFIKSLALENSENFQIEDLVRQIQQKIETKSSKHLEQLGHRSLSTSQSHKLLPSEHKCPTEIESKEDQSSHTKLNSQGLPLINPEDLEDLAVSRKRAFPLVDSFLKVCVSPFRRFFSFEPVNELTTKTFEENIKYETEELENCTAELTLQLSFSDYLHPATVEYKQKHGPLVVLGLQDHDFMKRFLESSRGHLESSVEHLHGIEAYVYSSAQLITLEDGSTNQDALIRTGRSFKWYEDANQAFADFRRRVEEFNGSVSEAIVCSKYADLNAKIEQALYSPQVNLKAAISDFKPASPPDSMFPKPFWLENDTSFVDS